MIFLIVSLRLYLQCSAVYFPVANSAEKRVQVNTSSRFTHGDSRCDEDFGELE